MEDTFGRLPDEILKYMCLLSTQPKITLEENSCINVKLELLGVEYKFFLNCDAEMIPLIEEFNNGTLTLLDFGDYQIDITKTVIGFYTEHTCMIIDINHLNSLKIVLMEYKNYLKSSVLPYK